MHTSMRILLSLAILVFAACSKSTPPPANAPARATSDVAALPAETANVVRAKLSATNIATEYAAMFEADQLERIVEHRHVGDTVLAGEYAFKGARLLEYRGAKLLEAAPLALQFDMQGTLLAGQEANVSESDIRALRNRAQLLRSHALAQRATRQHQ